jgi:hypothetical protein
MKTFIALTLLESVVLPLAKKFVKQTDNELDDSFVKGLELLAKAMKVGKVK